MSSGPSSTALQEPAIAEGPSSGARRAVRWTNGRKALFGVIGFGSVIIAGIGFVGSYAAVRVLAEKKGFGWFAPVFPLGVDLGIAVLLALDLALTWVGLRYPLLRYIAWLLTAATIGFNAASSWPDVLGAAMHATIPVLFISVTEAVRNAIAKATEIENNEHMDSIRLSRWLLAPVSTFRIWRSMKLWEMREYSVALDFYQNKRELRQELRHRYGWRWRSRTPWEELRPLRRARIGRPLTRMDLMAAAPPVALERVPQPELQPTAVPEPEPVQAVPASKVSSAPVPAPAAPAPLAVQAPAVLPTTAPAPVEPTPFSAPVEPARVVAPVFPQPQPALVPADVHAAAGPGAVEDALRGPDRGWVDASAGRDLVDPPGPAAPGPVGPSEAAPEPEVGEDLEDPEDHENPDERLDEDGGGALPPVDLGVAPPGESKVQRAERIYLAHQRAGIELTRNDLARWAGYQNLGSGRTQYNRLEQLHGPIVVQEGADQLDFDWRKPERAAEGAGARSLEAV